METEKDWSKYLVYVLFETWNFTLVADIFVEKVHVMKQNNIEQCWKLNLFFSIPIQSLVMSTLIIYIKDDLELSLF